MIALCMRPLQASAVMHSDGGKAEVCGMASGGPFKSECRPARTDQSEIVRQACSCAASVRSSFFPWSCLGVIGPVHAAMGAWSLNH